ncbi:UvrB/UvrC motif-containing protein [Fervidibacillus halotolerans]|uniref:UvrB/UvrC motif-containing protein n=1 Tax=Fervidibacillus halotolerans TaxID=2980027 RepID=A0A9E8M0T4_9BACI|nr:UvrB/UvrC motif-containing protein [Fervidibacillus halotolerans]WAA12892.1 UvrB/UvrC motif-containing protein [Fervidibacillus halotolerans]
MLCQLCGNHPASASFIKIVNGELKEFHICEQCAKKQEENIKGISNKVLNEQLLSNVLEGEPSDSPIMEKELVRDTRCPKCGLTYSQFAKTGRAGCVECYIQFADSLPTLLLRNHGTATHHGKVPKRKKTLIRDKQQLERLKKELQSLIEEEKYEQAAIIRDQIQELEKRVAGQ